MKILLDYFNELSSKIKSTKLDIDILVKKIEDKDKNKEDGIGINRRIISSRKIEPMTRIRKDISEVKSEQESPEIQFIIDKVEDLFK